MVKLVPNRFLFRFEFPLYRCRRPPKLDGRVDDWEGRFLLPRLHEIDGESGFADVFATWDEGGFYLGCRVRGKTGSPRCDPAQYWKGDNIRLMTDMRDTRAIHRATRFCRQFYFLPIGGGQDGQEAIAGAAKVNRATEDAPPVRAGELAAVARVSRSGYSLTAYLPAAVLSGFDPVENPRIGVFYIVEDQELGQQFLTVGDDLSWSVDPSTWATAVLTE